MASTISNTFVEEERRKISYYQVVYDDMWLELMETTGLGLVIDNADTEVEIEPFHAYNALCSS